MISLGVETQMRAALAKLDADADRAAAAAPGLVSRAWASLIGADSTASAATELARHAMDDAGRFRDRFDALMRDASSTDAQGLAFVADATSSYAGGAAGQIVEEDAYLLSPAGAAAETAKGTLSDITAKLPALGIGLGVVLVAAAVLVIRDSNRERRRA